MPGGASLVQPAHGGGSGRLSQKLRIRPCVGPDHHMDPGNRALNDTVHQGCSGKPACNHCVGRTADPGGIQGDVGAGRFAGIAGRKHSPPISGFHIYCLSPRLLRSGFLARWARTPAATVRMGASSAISNSSLATIATPEP